LLLPSAVEKYEKEIASAAGIPKELVIIHIESDEPGLKSYKSFDAAAKSDEFPFLYLDHNGKIRSTEDKFSLATKGAAPKMLYVFTKEGYKHKNCSFVQKALRVEVSAFNIIRSFV
jgi:hypothetical protein